jgi:predicted peptidase
MKRSMQIVAVSVALCSVTGDVRLNAAQADVDGFLQRTFTGTRIREMPYRLFVPAERERSRPLPAVVYLHGSGGAGTDNIKQISGGNTRGTHLWISREVQAQHPAFVIAPQLPGDNLWSAPNSDDLAPYAHAVVELLASLSKEFAIDPERIYLVGQSRGGRGTWDLIAKRPDLFAAAVPVCGDGNTTRIMTARDVPVWAFHGAKDDTVPVIGSREMTAALRAAGGTVKYTEYPDAGHDVWTLAFAEPGLPEWLFSQKRRRR